MAYDGGTPALGAGRLGSTPSTPTERNEGGMQKVNCFTFIGRRTPEQYRASWRDCEVVVRPSVATATREPRPTSQHSD